MKLYLIQHEQSLPKEKDPERPLNEAGKAETEKIARFLKSKDVTIDIIWHSKKARSVQTARIISEHILCEGITERDDLNPLDPVDKFPQEILKQDKDLAIVGHLPFLQKLVSLLLIGRQDLEPISFIYSSAICLEYRDTWRMAWFVLPNMV